MIGKLFSSGGGKKKDAWKGLSSELWPRSEIISVLSSRYDTFEHIRDEDGFALYGARDNNIQFVVALVTVFGAEDLISEVGFIARFNGAQIGQTQLEALNRTLHLSMAAFDNDGDIYLIGGVHAQGAFDQTAFSMVLESWRRDLSLLIMGLSGAASFMDAFPASKLSIVQKYAMNEAPSGSEREFASGGPSDMLSKFMGSAKVSFAACDECGGRGRRGLIARTCGACDGAGMIKSASRRG